MMTKRWAILLLHVAYWLTYLMLVSLFITATWHSHVPRSAGSILYILFKSPLGCAVVYPAVLSFYIFYGVLFTRLLQSKRFVPLALTALLTMLLISLLYLGLLQLVAPPQMRAVDRVTLAAITGMIAVIALIHGVVALVVRGFVAWYGDIRLKEQLTKKNDEMELALLKSQLNPHFLFNTLHNIDILIEKDAVKASAYLNKLSDIIRFMLYETRTGRISLAKELTYIGKYIDLQKIRTANPDYVRYEVEGDPQGQMIEPMLFIPFIENAFKHAGHKKKEDAIRIRFRIGKDSIIFDCENSYHPYPHEHPDHGGLGNDLIRKRLMLLYPGCHELDLAMDSDSYKAKLTLYGNPN